MHVKLWGVRGSLPTPLTPSTIEKKITTVLQEFAEQGKSGKLPEPEKFLRTLPAHKFGGYGGNTACMEVIGEQDSHLIIDTGSGIRGLGEILLSGPCGQGKGRVNILFTHFHWDHMIGLPFFIPAFIPGNEIHCYSVSPGLEECVKRMFCKPNFPVPYDKLGAKFVFHDLTPRETVEFGSLKVTPYELDHPDPCWGYKIAEHGKIFSYCVDTEGVRVSQKDLGPDLPLYQDVDVMIYDAQYTFLEATEKINWGHASGPIGLDIAMREGIKRVYFIHHDPAASDEKVSMAERQTKEYYDSRLSLADDGEALSPVEWCFAQEGMHIEI